MHVPADDARNAVASSSDHPHLERLHTATRVRLDDGALPECSACGRSIDPGVRYKCVTARDRSGSVHEFVFCDADCLDCGDALAPRAATRR